MSQHRVPSDRTCAPCLKRADRRWPPSRAGLVLMVCLLVIAFTSTMALGVINTQASRLALASNVKEHAQAEQLAEAGVQHALSLLLWNRSWQGKRGWIEFPRRSGNEYTFTVSAVAGFVTIQATGRTAHATVHKEVTHAF